MSVVNHTPFAAIAFRHYNLAGELNGVVAVRGTFRLVQDGPLAIAAQQEPLALTDVYAGEDPHACDLITQSNLVPFKPGTDVTFVGAAYTSDTEPAQSWTCGLSVGALCKDLRVHGRRDWIDVRHGEPKRRRLAPKKATRTWSMGAAQSQTYVVLSWEQAFGGSLPAADAAEAYPANPLGCGILNDTVADDLGRVRAPQIEAIEAPISDPGVQYEPHNLAPIAPFWAQRLQYAGTYDAHWLDTRHPLLPRDFDFRFWQCAHPDLIARPWLAGDEPFELRNLLYGHPRVRGTLPGIGLRMQLPRAAAMGVSDLVLDGVHFDLRPGVGRVFLTWRAGFPWPDGAGQPRIMAHERLPQAV